MTLQRLICCLAFVAFVSSQNLSCDRTGILPVWPLPGCYNNGTGVVYLRDGVPWYLNNQQVSTDPDGVGTTQFPGFVEASQQVTSIVESAIKRTYKILFYEHFVPTKFHPDAPYQWEPPPDDGNQPSSIRRIDIFTTLQDTWEVFKGPAGSTDESYTLSLIETNIKINATTAIGVIRALDSLTQLFYTHTTPAGTLPVAGTPGSIYTNFSPVYISDRPQFPHRGLLLDIARSFLPVADILRTIDALSWNKFSRLHLHATDAQSFPLEIIELNQLTALGPYSINETYRVADINLIQQYGLYRGVQVFVEVDMPAHAGAIAKAYSSLITCYQMENWLLYSSQPPSGQLKLKDPGVNFVLEVGLESLLGQIAPYSNYFHMGGDEINPNCYLFEENLNTNDTVQLRPLLQTFVDNNLRRIGNKGMTAICWEDLLIDWNLQVGGSTVIQTWRGQDSIQKVTSAGYQVIVGDTDNWYLDAGLGAWLNFAPPNDSSAYYPYDDYTGIKLNNWRKMYAYDPTEGLSAQEASLVLGGEVSMYTEQVDAATLDGVVWPRASAVGEVLWSGAKDWTGQNRSQITASPRLSEFRERLLLRGIKGNMVQMIYCLQGSGYSCSLRSVGNNQPGPDGTFGVTDTAAGLTAGQDAGGGAAVAAGAAAAGAVGGAAGGAA